MKITPYMKIASAAIIVAGTGYLLLRAKRRSGEGGDSTPAEEDVQKTIPKDLLSAIANKSIIGKPVYTKLDYVKLRVENRVNDGFLNNVVGEISQKGTLLGKVTEIKTDASNAVNPNTGKPYNWIRVKVTEEVYDEIGCNKWYKSCTPYKNFAAVYVREDVITLKK